MHLLAENYTQEGEGVFVPLDPREEELEFYLETIISIYSKHEHDSKNWINILTNEESKFLNDSMDLFKELLKINFEDQLEIESLLLHEGFSPNMKDELEFIICIKNKNNEAENINFVFYFEVDEAENIICFKLKDFPDN